MKPRKSPCSAWARIGGRPDVATRSRSATRLLAKPSDCWRTSFCRPCHRPRRPARWRPEPLRHPYSRPCALDEADAQDAGNCKSSDLTLEPCDADECSLVRDLATPVCLSVRPDTPAPSRWGPDRPERPSAFVVDHAGVLVGVVSARTYVRPWNNQRRKLAQG